MYDTITVKIKQNYGIERIYPVCERAIWLAALTGTKTFTKEHIEIIKKLGYTVEVQQRTL